jgi:hypothetical protein
MRQVLTIAVATILASLTLTLSSAQVLTDELEPPYALRITSPDEDLDGAFVQTDIGDGIGLFIRSSCNSPISTAWTFSTIGPLNGTEFLNATTELITLGSRFHAWDPEPLSMHMFAANQTIAKTGYPGSAWPSVYIAARWGFGIQRDEDGRWIMGTGMEFGDWRAQPDTYLHKKDTWSIFWWSGKCLARHPRGQPSNTRVID